MKRQTGAVNVPIALFSLAIAFGLWFAVFPVRSVKTRTRFDVAVDPITLDPSLQKRFVLVGKPPSTITLWLRLSEDEAKSFTNTHATVDKMPINLHTGINRFAVSIYPRELEQLAKEEGAIPSVPVELETYKKIDRVPIIVDTSGNLSNSTLVVNEMTIEPKTASIEGPESVVSQVKSIHATLPLESVMPQSPAPVDVSLDAFDSKNHVVSGGGMEIHPSTVQVTPKLSQKPSTKQLFVEANFAGHVPEGYEVTGFTVTPNPITASGSSMALKRVANVQTQVIDVSQLTSSQVLTVQLVMPPDVHLDATEVRVTLRIAQKSVKTLNPPASKPGSTAGAAGSPGQGP